MMGGGVVVDGMTRMDLARGRGNQRCDPCCRSKSKKRYPQISQIIADGRPYLRESGGILTLVSDRSKEGILTLLSGLAAEGRDTRDGRKLAGISSFFVFSVDCGWARGKGHCVAGLALVLKGCVVEWLEVDEWMG